MCVFRATSPYEEADFTAAKIRSLVLHEGYRYRDISVICRDGERYTRLFAAALRRWEIPAFLSEARTVDAEPLMRFVLSAFQIVSGSRKWRSEDVLAMLKTGITSFTAEELAQLENYVYTWKLNGASAWCSPFTKHPDGFGKPMEDTAAETLPFIRFSSILIWSKASRYFAARSKMPGAMTFPPLKCAFGICSWKYSTKWQACSVNRSSRVKNTEGS